MLLFFGGNNHRKITKIKTNLLYCFNVLFINACVTHLYFQELSLYTKLNKVRFLISVQISHLLSALPFAKLSITVSAIFFIYLRPSTADHST